VLFVGLGEGVVVVVVPVDVVVGVVDDVVDEEEVLPDAEVVVVIVPDPAKKCSRKITLKFKLIKITNLNRC
jgi:hypothetical protein